MEHAPSSSGTDAFPVGPPAGRRTERPSVALIVLLVVYLLLRLAGSGSSLMQTGKGKKPVAPSAASESSGSLDGFLSTDLSAKAAYLAGADPTKSYVTPDRKALREALSSAERFDIATANSPAAARRVIILRALLHKDPLAPVRKKYQPLAAFAIPIPAGDRTPDIVAVRREGDAWKAVFSHKLSPSQFDAAARTIGASPNIRWWKWPALSVVSTESGDLSEASRYATKARDAAIGAVAGFGALSLLEVGLSLLGVVLLVIGIAAAVARAQGKNVAFFYGMWQVMPEPEPRKLTSNDLLTVFVLYLVVSEFLLVILAGFGGIGPGHLFAFHGAVSPFLPALHRLPPDQREVFVVGMEAVDYIVSALPAFGLLVWYARRRGASLSEIGWTRKDRAINVLYGMGGYAMAVPILLLASVLTKHAFSHAPDPPNPVIPELVFSTSPLVTIILAGLAVACAPIVEELLFRGALFNGAKLRLGVWPAIILSGLVFGCVHPVGIAEQLTLSTLGMVFAWMAETRKSLAPSMTAHAMQNGFATLMLILLTKS